MPQAKLRTWSAFTLDAKQPKFDVIDNLRKVSTGGDFRKQLLNFI